MASISDSSTVPAHDAGNGQEASANASRIVVSNNTASGSNSTNDYTRPDLSSQPTPTSQMHEFRSRRPSSTFSANAEHSDIAQRAPPSPASAKSKSGTPQPKLAEQPTAASFRASIANENVTGPTQYGTRSRNRTGNARPNYAEDQEMDFELAAPQANTAIAEPAATRLLFRPQQSAETRHTPEASFNRFVAVNTNGIPPQPSAAKEPIPGTSKFSAVPSKKRKAAGNSTTTGSTSAGPAFTSQAVVRKSLSASNTHPVRETNMMTFEKSRAVLKDGKLVADDGTAIAVN
ncbi:hypothetical protein LTR28_004514, partial [Elasticomyces elasticus]